MSNKRWILAILITMVVLIQGCTNIPVETGEKIVPPNNRHIPLEGTWRVIKRLDIEIMPEDNSTGDDAIIDSLVSFTASEAVFGSDRASDIQYKIRRVRANDFFLYQYKVTAEDLGIHNEKIDVVSVSSKNKPFYEFIKLDDNNIITFIDNSFYMLTKQSDECDVLTYDENPDMSRLHAENNSYDDDFLHSGVLLGLKRVSGSSDGNYDIIYRTLWIRSENRSVYPILGVSNLFAPRKTGFWEIGSVSNKADGFIYDILYAHPSFLYDNPSLEVDLSLESANEFAQMPRDSHLRRHIRYVGNDYIAVEVISMTDNSSHINRVYQVLPIDNIQNSRGIKISDISGEEGRNAFFNSIQSSLEVKNMRQIDVLDNEPSEENFTVARRNGHWIMRGRIRYKDTNNINEYLDFNINIIPPTKLVNYDELCISWNSIKAKLPSAIDAYTSPNKDILIALDIDNIYVYSIHENELSDKPICKIPLHEGEEVVMAEWATGAYVERWDKCFKAKKPIEIDTQEK